jgi:chitobiase/beta-hexosaminidase-like protein
MRSALLVLLLGAVAAAAQAQDAGQQAAQQAAQQASQQAMQAAQQANQQAMQAAQQANQQSAQAAQQAASASSTTWGPGLAAMPKFSVKPGTYSSLVTVRITDSTRDAVIYYTTDGWTPTPQSPVYRGPITIDRDTTLQAIAVAPYNYRSVVAVAKYTVNPAPSTSSSASPDADAAAIAAANPPVVSDGVANPGPLQQSADAAKNAGAAKGSAPGFLLQQDTPVSLVFDDALTSKTAQVGDTIHLSVAEDVSIDGNVIVPKGTKAIATVVAINHTGPGGAPGDISFEADSMTVRGTLVKLYGSATREGQAHLPNAAVLIPVVGPFTAFRHGTDAVIDKGTPFTAFVDSNTQLAVLSK